MSKLTWDAIGSHYYETGIKDVVLYPYDTDKKAYSTGYAWNGVTAMNESPSGAEASDLYADDIKYLTLRSAEEFGFTIEAYTYPPEFEACDGSASIADDAIPGMKIGQQSRQTFALAYTTRLGDDVSGNTANEKIHIIYGATASPSSRDYATINDSPEAITFSWECECVQVDFNNNAAVTGKVATLTFDKNKLEKKKVTPTSGTETNQWALLEKMLYGDSDTDAHLLLPDDLVTYLTTGVDSSLSTT